MNTARATTAPLRHADRFFVGGDWVEPASDATVDVIDSGTEEVYYSIATAAPDDMARAVAAARRAFDDGPWPRLTHGERADYIRALGAALAERNDVLSQLWPRESGVL
jgi:acyl-CoA reductase-like NAD-dependent aldehyde dehydrogenase